MMTSISLFRDLRLILSLISAVTTFSLMYVCASSRVLKKMALPLRSLASYHQRYPLYLRTNTLLSPSVSLATMKRLGRCSMR